MFLIYINDLPDILDKDTVCAISADDTKIYRKVSSNNDRRVLQSDVDMLLKWGNQWGLKFNPTKCNAMCIGTSDNNLINAYKLGGTVMPACLMYTFT